MIAACMRTLVVEILYPIQEMRLPKMDISSHFLRMRFKTILDSESPVHGVRIDQRWFSIHETRFLKSLERLHAPVPKDRYVGWGVQGSSASQLSPKTNFNVNCNHEANK